MGGLVLQRLYFQPVENTLDAFENVFADPLGSSLIGASGCFVNVSELAGFETYTKRRFGFLRSGFLRHFIECSCMTGVLQEVLNPKRPYIQYRKSAAENKA